VSADGDLCAHHARLALTWDGNTSSMVTMQGSEAPRERIAGKTETEPLELTSQASARPSAVRPALALTAAEEVETIRRVLLEAATNTTRESWATCSCPACFSSAPESIAPSCGLTND